MRVRVLVSPFPRSLQFPVHDWLGLCMAPLVGQGLIEYLCAEKVKAILQATVV
jgi:hypothetical protein